MLTTGQEALWRTAAFADAGADILFIDALETREEMHAFCASGGRASQTPKVSSFWLMSFLMSLSMFLAKLWLPSKHCERLVSGCRTKKSAEGRMCVITDGKHA